MMIILGCRIICIGHLVDLRGRLVINVVITGAKIILVLEKSRKLEFSSE